MLSGHLSYRVDGRRASGRTEVVATKGVLVASMALKRLTTTVVFATQLLRNFAVILFWSINTFLSYLSMARLLCFAVSVLMSMLRFGWLSSSWRYRCGDSVGPFDDACDGVGFVGVKFRPAEEVDYRPRSCRSWAGSSLFISCQDGQKRDLSFAILLSPQRLSKVLKDPP